MFSIRLSTTTLPSSPALAAPDLDAVIARTDDGVARDHKTARIQGMDGGLNRVGDRRAADLAVDRAAMDAVATGAQDLAIGDPDGACILQMNEPASVGQGAPHSVECQV